LTAERKKRAKPDLVRYVALQKGATAHLHFWRAAGKSAA
jgi:hypothetical protein